MTRKSIDKIDFFKENPEVVEWLEKKERGSAQTRRAYEHIIYHYFQWLKKNKGFQNAKQLLEDYGRSKDKPREHYKMAEEYVMKGELGTKSYLFRAQNWNTIRSFYKDNWCSLPDVKLDLRITETDEAKLREKQGLEPMRLEDVKTLLGPAKIRDKAICLILLASGMRTGDFCWQFNTTEAPNILRQLHEGKCPIKINLLASRSTEKRPQYFTFIGKDAIDALKQYLAVRGEPKEGEPIFITQMGKPMQGKVIDKQVEILKKQSGLVKKDFTPHGFRRLFKSEAIHQGVTEVIAEFFLGHQLDAMGYNILDQTRPEYFESEYITKIEPALNIISSVGVIYDEEEARKKNIIDAYAISMKFTPEAAKELHKILEPIKLAEGLYTFLPKLTPELMKELSSIPSEQRTKKIDELLTKTEHNGGSQFESKIIDADNETELLQSINEGWEIVKELSNGKIVLRKGVV